MGSGKRPRCVGVVKTGRRGYRVVIIRGRIGWQQARPRSVSGAAVALQTGPAEERRRGEGGREATPGSRPVDQARGGGTLRKRHE